MLGTKQSVPWPLRLWPCFPSCQPLLQRGPQGLILLLVHYGIDSYPSLNPSMLNTSGLQTTDHYSKIKKPPLFGAVLTVSTHCKCKAHLTAAEQTLWVVTSVVHSPAGFAFKFPGRHDCAKGHCATIGWTLCLQHGKMVSTAYCGDNCSTAQDPACARKPLLYTNAINLNQSTSYLG